MTQPPIPQRIGDAQRDAAVTRLRQAMEEGRITLAEFDERTDAALRARTQADLDPLFTDLPTLPPQGVNPAALAVPSAGVPVAPWGGDATPASSTEVATQGPTSRAAYVLSAIAWPAALIFCFATGWRFWWVVMIPALLLGPLLRALGSNPDAERRARRERRQQRRLDR